MPAMRFSSGVHQQGTATWHLTQAIAHAAMRSSLAKYDRCIPGVRMYVQRLPFKRFVHRCPVGIGSGSGTIALHCDVVVVTRVEYAL